MGCEDYLRRMWYMEGDRYPDPLPEKIKDFDPDKLTIEYCKKGVIVRNPAGPARGAHRARQWYLEWPDKAPIVKNYDVDDFLYFQTIEIMQRHLTEDADGVFCPMTPVHGGRLARYHNTDIDLGTVGSGAMMLTKACQDKLVQGGFQWPHYKGNDKYFHFFIQSNRKSYKFIAVKEDGLYFYLK